MSKDTKLQRRDLLRGGVAVVAVAAAGRTFATAPTPTQPEGPFYPKQQPVDSDADLTHVEGREGTAEGQVIRVSGQVLDEDGQPVADARVDVWQANSHGRYDHEDDPANAPLDPNFQGSAVLRTDADGRYAFTTIKPAAYAAMEDWTRPPHIHFKVARRGYRELITQMYFAGEPLNEKDALFLDTPEAERHRLVVDFQHDGGVPKGHFDIVLGRVRPA
ncbi:MAG: protocatechuate 3,4-dioxygenase [Xanthomonadales bacterium]|nr:protocatechuate 3,4-dioxygenase [Xanthomonadales bacterium]